MTLQEHCQANRVHLVTPRTESSAAVVHSTVHNNPNHKDLWRLDDYIVSTATCTLVWLVPKAGFAG